MAGKKKAETVTRRTKKRKAEIVLPGTQTVIYQSNRVTNGRFVFSLIQFRIFLYMMKTLQGAIKKSMDSQPWQQLVLFEDAESVELTEAETVTDEEIKNTDQGRVAVTIPLCEIARPDQYRDVIAAAEDMRRIDIKFKSTERKEYLDLAGLFAKVSVPPNTKGGKHIVVTLLSEVAKHLIEIDKNGKGVPEKYTKFLYEIAFSASSPNTILLYIKISSWKYNGGFKISLDDLKQDLGLSPTDYPNYYDFKRRVLLPAQKELTGKADCWFNCTDKDFEIRQGRKVSVLNFKVITPDLEDVNRNKAFSLREMLKRELFLKAPHMEQLEHLFQGNFDYGAIVMKIQQLKDHLTEKGANIAKPQEYCVVALLNEFGAAK